MGPIDAWWNRHFPAHSYARLAFLMVAAPVTSLLVVAVFVLGGDEFTWARYFMLTTASEVMVLFAWIVARMRQDEIDFDKENEEFERRIFPWKREQAPWHLPQEEPALEEPAPVADIILEAPKKPSIPTLYDFALTLLVSFITWALMMLVLFDFGSSTADKWSYAAIGGFFFAIVIWFRYSVLIPILLSIAVGFIGGTFMHLVLTFMGDTDTIPIYIAIASVLAFTFLMPMWLRLRALRGKFERYRIPNWVFTSVISILLLIGLAFTSFGSDYSAPPAVAGDFTPPPFAPVSDDRGTSSNEAAALTLYYAWRNGDEAAARRVAADSAVEELFAREFDPSARFAGCGLNQYRVEECLIRRTEDQILLTMNSQSVNRFYVEAIFEVQFDYPLDLSPESPTPTPSPSI